MSKIIVIVGPTGIGKTKLSIELAHLFDAEIINADSMQVYKGLDIGTAKITEKEKEGIKHHLLDIKNITEDYSVFDYQKDCRNKIDEIFFRGKNVIIVGGTGLYIKAALYDYRLEEKKYIENDYNNLSNDEIYYKIKEFNSKIEIDKNNRRRLVRCLNKIEHNDYQEFVEPKLLYDDVIFIGLETSRDILYGKINERVDKMIPGLLLEVKKFFDNRIDSKALNTGIGYKELFPYFAGTSSLIECIEEIKKHTRKYAKRQFTWFKNQMNIKWFSVDYNDFNKTIEEVKNYLNSK